MNCQLIPEPIKMSKTFAKWYLWAKDRGDDPNAVALISILRAMHDVKHPDIKRQLSVSARQLIDKLKLSTTR